MNTFRFALSLTLAVTASIAAQAQPAQRAATTMEFAPVTETLTKDMLCKAQGKSYSVGAILTVGDLVFRCTPSLLDPGDGASAEARWVQIRLVAPTKQHGPAGAGAKTSPGT